MRQSLYSISVSPSDTTEFLITAIPAYVTQSGFDYLVYHRQPDWQPWLQQVIRHLGDSAVIKKGPAGGGDSDNLSVIATVAKGSNP